MLFPIFLKFDSYAPRIVSAPFLILSRFKDSWIRAQVLVLSPPGGLIRQNLGITDKFLESRKLNFETEEIILNFVQPIQHFRQTELGEVTINQIWTWDFGDAIFGQSRSIYLLNPLDPVAGYHLFNQVIDTILGLGYFE